MKDSTKLIFNKLVFSGIILFLILLLQPFEVFYFIKNIPVLFPGGWVGVEQRDLLLLIQAIMLIFILPVYVLTFVFSWWYRADNNKSTYDPHLIDNSIAEYIWWGLPLIFTIFIAVVTYIKTHELDPYKPLKSDNKTVVIEVVALQWKWLFIYPEERIATVNYIKIPKDHPIHFKITADAPMNSFWIPRLGGQIYAMPGMQTELFLIANELGSFRGSSANISGTGFAGMTFVTEATEEKEFLSWVHEMKRSSQGLDMVEYKKLVEPSKYVPPKFFQLKDENLFNQIIMQYMAPKKV